MHVPGCALADELLHQQKLSGDDDSPNPGASYAAVHQLLLVGLVQLALEMGGHLESLWHPYGVISEYIYTRILYIYVYRW